jgi:hypothetical protein
VFSVKLSTPFLENELLGFARNKSDTNACCEDAHVNLIPVECPNGYESGNDAPDAMMDMDTFDVQANLHIVSEESSQERS